MSLAILQESVHVIMTQEDRDPNVITTKTRIRDFTSMNPQGFMI